MRNLTQSSLVVLGLGVSTALPAGTFNADFNDGLVPPGSQVFGNDDGTWLPVVEAGGVEGSPCLKLTKAVNSQWGTLIIEDLDAWAYVYGFRATFMARVGGGTATPADGWSFCVAPDLPDGIFGETGAGSGLILQFDTYDNVDADPNNSTGEAPQIRLVVGGQTVATTPLLPLTDLINNAFVPVEILLQADGSLSLTYNGKVHFSNLYFPGYQALAGSRFGIGARTGGLNANHFIDDLTIETYLAPLVGIAENPQDQTVVEGSPATFSIAVNNGEAATVEWLRDDAVIPGATDFTYTLGAATLADSGATFSARVTVGTSTVTSTVATLTVVRIDLPASPVVSYNFNDGMLPLEAFVYGAGWDASGWYEWYPYVSYFGGVGDSGVLQLTEAVSSQGGAFLISDPHAGLPVYGVGARFDVRIGGGTEPPADGMSFNFANDLPDSTVGDAEEGAGSGLRVCFDTFDNGNGEAPAITLKWGTTVVDEVKTTLDEITTGDGFADVIIRLTPDGLLDVAWNGKVLLYRVPVPGFGSIANGRFGFYARTGGLNANHWVDNLRIYTYLTAPLRISSQPESLTVLVGQPAGFDVEVSTPAGASYEWFRDDAPIPGATASTYTIPAAVAGDDGAVFKVEVTLGGETVMSDEAVLSVLDLAAPTSPQLSYDFNTGQPAGTDLGGTAPLGTTQVAFIDSFGGVGDSGVLKLTTSENRQAGGFRSAPVESGAQLLEFILAADVLAGNGTTGVPADGFSINLGSDVPITAPGDAENGGGTGLTVAFDTYDNDDADPNNEAGEAPSIDIRYGGQLVATKRVPLALLNSGVFAPVLLRVQESGILDLAFGGTVIYHNLQLPGYLPMSGVKIAVYARTGGANASYWFDNLRLGYTIPTAVTITGEPSDTLVLAGQSATFQVQVSNPQGVTYQWRRGGTAIGGATLSSYTTPSLSLADDGTGYSVVVTAPGGTVTSRTAIAGVMEKFDAGASPAVNLNFNDGLVPPGGAVFGTAFIQWAGGVGGSGFLQLTEAVNDQYGTFLFDTPAGSTPIADFTATWMMLVGGGTAVPADGFCFLVGEDIADGTFGEEGTGSGLVVSFDTFRNVNENAPEITVRYNGAEVMNRPFDISVLHTGTEFVQVGVRVNRAGTLDLYYGDTAVYRGLPLPGYVPIGPGRFGWGAHTGGLNDNHWADDIKIAFNTQPALGPTITAQLSGGNIVLTWSGGGTLQWTSALPGGWSNVDGAISGHAVPTDQPARFYRVVQ